MDASIEKKVIALEEWMKANEDIPSMAPVKGLRRVVEPAGKVSHVNEESLTSSSKMNNSNEKAEEAGEDGGKERSHVKQNEEPAAAGDGSDTQIRDEV